MTKKDAMKLIRAAERKREGKNFTRWYSSVHPQRNGEAIVRTWACKTYKGKPLILLASEYYTDGRTPKVSGRCLTSIWDNCHHWSWLDYGGSSHISAWENVDDERDEMLEPKYAHKYGRGIEFYGLGTWVNGFEGTKYEYGQFFKSGLRVSDWIDVMHISPKAELLIKSGLNRWLDPRYMLALVDNKALLNFVRERAKLYSATSPYYVIRDFAKSGADPLNIDRVNAYVIAEQYHFTELVFSPIHIYNWMKRFKVRASALRHHIDNIKELGMDVTYEPHILPKKGFARYAKMIENRLLAQREIQRIEREEREEAKRREEEKIARKARIWARKEIKRLLAAGKIRPNFTIVIPSTQTELVAEGNAMHNCIGSMYRDNWSVGDCELAFIRKDGKPYIDIEVRGGRIIQARYARNVAVDEHSADYKICEAVRAVFAESKNKKRKAA